jgi:moderate conductance mechanosensitive channel
MTLLAPALGTSTPEDCWDPASNDDLCRIVHEWTGSEGLARSADWLIAKPASILLLVVIGVVVRWLLHRMIDGLVKRATEGNVPAVLQHGKVGQARELLLESGPIAIERRQQRTRTMASLLKSVSTGVIFSVVAFMAIATLGYNIAPLIASAGILGVALGFGAQSLVKDFLSGIFMILEDQYGVGDAVDLGEASGSVEAVGLRVTRIRDVNGTVWYVRNGEILRVGNMSQNWARTVLDIPVAFTEDLDRVQEVLRDEAHALWEDQEFRELILEEPEVWGIERWDPDGVVIRVVLKTAPLEQWEVAREMRQRIKSRFDAEHIEIPLPQRMVWHRHEPARESTDDAEGSRDEEPPE